MSDIATLVKEILAAHLANPNVKIDAADIPGHIEKIHAAMEKVSLGGVAPGALVASLPMPVAPDKMPKPAESALESSSIRIRRNPRAGNHVAQSIWPGQPASLTDKFEKLISEFGLPRDTRGNPIMAKTHDRLMTEDGLKVLDPISGVYYSMLKHHLRSAYNLTHSELLIMYKLTAQQLPETAPLYSTTKSVAARNMGLGKRPRNKAA